jgi:hypothetical protein
LSSLESPPEVKVDIDPSSGLTILCARNDEPVEFKKCVSAGWITAAIDDQGKAWIFPFGRAITTIPDLPTGRVEEFNHVQNIGVGRTHIAIVSGNENMEV